MRSPSVDNHAGPFEGLSGNSGLKDHCQLDGQEKRRRGTTKPQVYGSLEPRQLLASAGPESNTLPTIDGLGAELVPQIEVQNQDSLSVDATSSAIQSWQRDGVVIDRASDLV